MGFFEMTGSVAQEHVKRTVDTILGGQVTTTCQKAAQKDRLGRKNVSLQTTTVQWSKGHQNDDLCWRCTRFKGLFCETIRASQANVTLLVDWKNVSWADDCVSTRSCICLIKQ